MNSELDEMRQEIEEYQKLVNMRDAVLRLKANPDYLLVLEHGFFGKEAVRYLEASTDPSLRMDSRADSLAIAQSGSHVRRFLNATIQMGNNAEKSIRAIQGEMSELSRE